MKEPTDEQIAEAIKLVMPIYKVKEVPKKKPFEIDFKNLPILDDEEPFSY